MPPFDFTASGAVVAALAVAIMFPAILFAAVRQRSISGRNALQFLLSATFAIACWVTASSYFGGPFLDHWIDWVVGAMLLGGALLIYLEIWALLSRGYTLGLMLTLHKARSPVSTADLARSYRGGFGLDWIMQHRLSGLLATRMVRLDGDNVSLTRYLGVPVACIYKILIQIHGLRRTG